MATAPAGQTGLRLAIAAASLLLAWRIIHVNAVTFDEDGRVRMPAMPTAFEAAPKERRALERATLEAILDRNPAEVAALLMLAEDFARSGEPHRAAGAYRALLDLAPIDRQVLTRAAAHFVRTGDPRTVEILARLADRYPAARAQAYPLLAGTLSSALYREAWREIAARRPAWLEPFLADSCARGVAPALLAPLVAGRPPGGVGSAEARCLVERLQGTDQWEAAYHLWLGTLPAGRLASVGYVFNGSFEHDSPGHGFDWILQRNPEMHAGHVAEFANARGGAGQRALRVAYNGKRQGGIPVRQFLSLPAGNYRLDGLVRTQGIQATRGIQWTVRCVSKGSALGPVAASERFVGSGEWRAFSLDLAVGKSCPGQVLQLEPAGREGSVAYVTGTAWFDGFTIRRLPGPN